MCDTAESVIKGLIRRDIHEVMRLESQTRVTLVDRMIIAKLTIHKAALDEVLTEITRRKSGNRTEATG